jgi:hypothetical protein
MLWPIVVELANAQHGTVARWQLLARGIPGKVIDNWVAAGVLHVWHRGVYAVGHRVLGAHGRRKAAALAGGERSALCCQTAGDFLNVRPNASGTVHLWVPNQRGRKIDGIVCHRFGDMLEEDIEEVNGIRTTRPMRVLADMAGTWDVETLEKAFARTELNQRFDLRHLDAILARRPNRAGLRKIRYVMGIYEGPVPDMTALELRGMELVKLAGLPTPIPQQHVGLHRVDFYWPDRRLIMEMDSIRWHLTIGRWQSDQDRTNEHLADGIATTRVSWERALQPATVDRLSRIYRNRAVVL